MAETLNQAAGRLARGALKDGFMAYDVRKVHPYLDAAGALLYGRIRLKNTSTGEKWIRPLHCVGGEFRLGEPSFTNGKPLYRLERLAENHDAVVIVCEGEMCVDALLDAGALATTSGAADSAPKADWQPLAGRDVLIWPDHDEAGRRYGEAVAVALSGVARSVRVIDVAALGLPPKGDAVDWLAAHPDSTAEDVAALPCLTGAASCTQVFPAPAHENAPTGDIDRGAVVCLTCAADVQPEPITWLWPGWVAAGKMHVLGGAPGTGKTTIAMALAAAITTGGRWPDGTRAPVGDVVIWSGEDDPTDTLVPRLALAGADLCRIHFVSGVEDDGERRSFDPALDLEALRRALEALGAVRLLIVDPIVSAVSGDSHKNTEVRRGLQPLVDLAAGMRCALLGITHFSKGTGGRDPVERLTGSLAFGALARVVMVAAKHQEEGEDGRTTRLFCRAKSNIGPDDGGFEYDLQQGEPDAYPGIEASLVVWRGAVDGAARELLSNAESGGDDGEGGTLADAKRFLIGLLCDGPMSAKEVRSNADEAGYSWASIKRAQKALGVDAVKEGGHFGTGKQRWRWSLPAKGTEGTEGAHHAYLQGESLKALKNAEGAQQNNVSTFRKLEHLQGADAEDAEGAQREHLQASGVFVEVEV